jgi:hypothetical protein
MNRRPARTATEYLGSASQAGVRTSLGGDRGHTSRASRLRLVRKNTPAKRHRRGLPGSRLRRVPARRPARPRQDAGGSCVGLLGASLATESVLSPHSTPATHRRLRRIFLPSTHAAGAAVVGIAVASPGRHVGAARARFESGAGRWLRWRACLYALSLSIRRPRRVVRRRVLGLWTRSARGRHRREPSFTRVVARTPRDAD